MLPSPGPAPSRRVGIPRDRSGPKAVSLTLRMFIALSLLGGTVDITLIESIPVHLSGKRRNIVLKDAHARIGRAVGVTYSPFQLLVQPVIDSERMLRRVPNLTLVCS